MKTQGGTVPPLSTPMNMKRAILFPSALTTEIAGIMQFQFEEE